MELGSFFAADDFRSISGVSSFMGFPGRPSFLTVQDPHDPPPRDLTENKGVTVLYRGQRMKLNTKTLVEATREAKPAAMVALCDGQVRI